MNKKWFRALLRQRMLVAFLLIVQFIFMIYLLLSSSSTSSIISGILKFLSVVVSLYIFCPGISKWSGGLATRWKRRGAHETAADPFPACQGDRRLPYGDPCGAAGAVGRLHAGRRVLRDL